MRTPFPLTTAYLLAVEMRDTALLLDVGGVTRDVAAGSKLAELSWTVGEGVEFAARDAAEQLFVSAVTAAQARDWHLR